MQLTSFVARAVSVAALLSSCVAEAWVADDELGARQSSATDRRHHYYVQDLKVWEGLSEEAKLWTGVDRDREILVTYMPNLAMQNDALANESAELNFWRNQVGIWFAGFTYELHRSRARPSGVVLCGTNSGRRACTIH